MPWGFRRTVKIAPGIRFSLAKRSIGLSAGFKGARVRVNSRTGLGGRISAPGSGVYYDIHRHAQSAAPTQKARFTWPIALTYALLGVVCLTAFFAGGVWTYIGIAAALVGIWRFRRIRQRMTAIPSDDVDSSAIQPMSDSADTEVPETSSPPTDKIAPLWNASLGADASSSTPPTSSPAAANALITPVSDESETSTHLNSTTTKTHTAFTQREENGILQGAEIRIALSLTLFPGHTDSVGEEPTARYNGKATPLLQ